METIIYGALSIMVSIVGYYLVCFIYSCVVVYKQSEVFINQLKVGDDTNFGEISGLEGEYVIINRKPLVIHRSDIQPKEFKANKFLFLFDEKKK